MELTGSRVSAVSKGLQERMESMERMDATVPLAKRVSAAKWDLQVAMVHLVAMVSTGKTESMGAMVRRVRKATKAILVR
jgi:hypothetical protein